MKKRETVAQVTLTINVPYKEISDVAKSAETATKLAADAVVYMKDDAKDADAYLVTSKPSLVTIIREGD